MSATTAKRDLPFIVFVLTIAALYASNIDMLTHAWHMIAPWFDLGLNFK